MKKLAFFLLFCSLVSTGFCQVDRGSLALIGGGTVDFMPNSWSEGIFRWIIRQANGGKILILSCTDETGTLKQYFERLGTENVEYLKIQYRYIADHPDTYKAIEEAGAVFIVDHQQWQQFDQWKGTRTESAIRDAFAAGKVLAGIGEGITLLGGLMVDREKHRLPPALMVRKPLPASTTFISDYGSFQPGVFVEPSFMRRGGIPLALGKMARYSASFPASLSMAVGVDEKTALLIDDTLSGIVMGEGAVTVLSRTASTVIRLNSGMPPVMTHVRCDMMTEGFVYSFATNAILAAPPSADSGAESVSGAVPVAVNLNGSKPEFRRWGDFEVLNSDHDSCALQLGLLAERPGLENNSGMAVMTEAYSHSDYYENRLGGLLWGLANHPGHTGLAMDQGAVVEVTASGSCIPQPTTDQPSVLIFDSRNLAFHDYSRWKSFPDSHGKRQSVALTNLVIHLLASRCAYHLPTGNVLVLEEGGAF